MGEQRRVRSFPCVLPRPLGSGLARFGQIREDSRPSFGFEDRARHPCRVGLLRADARIAAVTTRPCAAAAANCSRGSEVARDWVWHPSTLSGDTTTHERSLFQKSNSMAARKIILLTAIFSAACGFLSHGRLAGADEAGEEQSACDQSSSDGGDGGNTSELPSDMPAGGTMHDTAAGDRVCAGGCLPADWAV